MIERRIAAALVTGAALLIAEVRFEHREVLGETWHAFIPLVCGALVLAVGIPACALWGTRSRRLLSAAFALCAAVGLLGAWFHSGGHPGRMLSRVAAAWAVPIGHDGGEKPGAAPPALAPLAFSGLGLLGLLVCSPRGVR